jgi:hypothetical protein
MPASKRPATMSLRPSSMTMSSTRHDVGLARRGSASTTTASITAEVWIGALIQIIGPQTSYFETSYQGLCMAGTRSNANALSKLHGMLLTASSVEADGLRAVSLRPSTPIRGRRGYSDHVSEADPANGAASMRSSFLTPRWRGQSPANPSLESDSLVTGKKYRESQQNRNRNASNPARHQRLTN